MANNKYRARKTKQQSPSVCKHAAPGPTKTTWTPRPAQGIYPIALLITSHGGPNTAIPTTPRIITLYPITADADWRGDFKVGSTGHGFAEMHATDTPSQLTTIVDITFESGQHERWETTTASTEGAAVEENQQQLLTPTLLPGVFDFLQASSMRGL